MSDLQKYIDIINNAISMDNSNEEDVECPNIGLPTSPSTRKALVESFNGREYTILEEQDSHITFDSISQDLNIPEEDVKEAIQLIMTNSLDDSSTLLEASKILVSGVVETIKPEGKGFDITYITNNDIYESTFFYMDKHYYYGNVGKFIEHDCDMSLVNKIK